ncbi:hypothetical protein CHLRE_03g212865v5 [Chlamydomonas reinhardtii]|uniref:Uncharacterized protein n=1 Tax=Chlamydomonas reinhardtii TaxID=3055 RepID=A0A2K3DZX2_CHLRE|nr:uncharacterized protein CHLRE_03g212865v5 [Chlamydomonas reinhardtii]PNW86088.1 hypothetical protein CHLRE_03g212865v5 [Chlamydomonas reinhardtii]
MSRAPDTIPAAAGATVAAAPVASAPAPAGPEGVEAAEAEAAAIRPHAGDGSSQHTAGAHSRGTPPAIPRPPADATTAAATTAIGTSSEPHEGAEHRQAGDATAPTATATDPAPTTTTTTTTGVAPPPPADDLVDVPRLHRRLAVYAAAYGLPAAAAAQLAALLATPLAARLLAAPPAALHAQHLVTDAYKPRMHVMYDRFMTGVTADFALVVRRAPPAADPAALPAAQPGLWRRFTAAAAALSRRHIGSAAVSGASTVSEANAALAYEQRYGSGNGYIFGYGEEPYGPYEVEALRTQFGLELPATLLERCRAQGVAPVTWQRIGGGVRQPPPAAAAAAAAATGGGGGGGGMRLPAAQSPVNHPHHEHEQQEHGHRLRHRGFPPPEEQEQETEQRYDSGFGSRGGLDDGGSASESEDGDGRSGAGTESGEAAAAWPVRPGLSPRLQVAGSGAAAAAAAAAGEEADYTGRVAIASGPIVAASLVETTLMQLFQETAVQAQAAALTKQYSTSSGAGSAEEHDSESSTRSSSSSGTSSSSSASVAGGGGAAGSTEAYCFDRTERLANSLVRLALTVERINGLRHGLRIALFAGRRSSDLLYLVLQNLYAAAHLAGYVGTSSLFAAAAVCRHWAGMHVPERERWGGPGRLVGTHAHEMSMALQQLLAPYDDEAGRRAGLRRPLALSPLLAHLLFLAANGGGGPGGGGATALADTFTTAAFIAVARAAAVPPGFRRDVESEYGWSIPEHARCFDLFRVWRIDSGRYEEVAAQVVAAWEERCGELAAAGRPPLRPPQLMHSNLDSVEQIAQVVALPERIRPATLAFGTLADGFLPFLPAHTAHTAHTAAVPGSNTDSNSQVAVAAAADTLNATSPAPQQPQHHQPLPQPPTSPPPKQQQQQQPQQQRPTIRLASVVMKLVQARPPRPLPPLVPAEPTTPTGTDAAAASGVFSPKAPPPRLPPCAVKLGDGEVGLGSKAQVDPRLPAAAAQRALQAAAELAHTSSSRRLDEAAVSAVLSEAYDAVTRDGVLMAAAADD